MSGEQEGKEVERQMDSTEETRRVETEIAETETPADGDSGNSSDEDE